MCWPHNYVGRKGKERGKKGVKQRKKWVETKRQVEKA